MITLDKFFNQKNQNNNIISKTKDKQKVNILYGHKFPKEWKVAELAEIFREANKNARKVKIKDNETYKLITVKLYAKGIVLRGIKLGKDIKTKTMFRVKASDFIFSKIDARNGAYGFVPQELDGAVVSSDFPILELDRSKAIDKFVYYYMSQPIVWETIRNYAIGTTNRRRIKVSEFLKIIKIPLPPLKEQHKIVYVLDTIKQAIEIQSKILEVLSELKKVIMNKLFTKGLDPNQPTKQTEIGKIPVHWEVRKVRDLFKVVTGTTPRTDNKEYWNGEICWITPRDLGKMHEDEIYVYNSERRISKYAIVKYNMKILPRGSLILSTRAPIGHVAILGTEATFNQGCKGLIIKEPSKVNSLYAYYYFLSKVRILQTMGKGTTFKEISKNALEEFIIVIPPMYEQLKISTILYSIDKKIRIIRNKKELLEELFTVMLRKLMSGQVNVSNLNIKFYTNNRFRV